MNKIVIFRKKNLIESKCKKRINLLFSTKQKILLILQQIIVSFSGSFSRRHVGYKLVCYTLRFMCNVKIILNYMFDLRRWNLWQTNVQILYVFIPFQLPEKKRWSKHVLTKFYTSINKLIWNYINQLAVKIYKLCHFFFKMCVVFFSYNFIILYKHDLNPIP
jgi:hypothetical protein